MMLRRVAMLEAVEFRAAWMDTRAGRRSAMFTIQSKTLFTLMVSAGLSAWACGSNGGADGPADRGPGGDDGGALDLGVVDAGPGEDAGAEDAAPGDTGGGVAIGPSGGTVGSEDGYAQITFPPGAVSEPVYPSAEPYPDAPLAEGLVAGRAYWFEPDGMTFDAPVEVTIAYEPGEVPAGTAESELVLLVVEGDEWIPISGSVPDPEAHAVTATVAHFSALSPGRLDARTVPGAGFVEFFQLRGTLVESTCSSPYPLEGQWRVTIGQGTLSFGLGTGTYSGGSAEGEHGMTIPVRPQDACYATVHVDWWLYFYSPYRFEAELEFDYAYTEGCGADDCGFIWEVEGTRPR